LWAANGCLPSPLGPRYRSTVPRLDADLNSPPQVTAMGMQVLFALWGVNVLIAIVLGAFVFLLGFVLRAYPKTAKQRGTVPLLRGLRKIGTVPGGFRIAS
jgi:hypothetical protein